MLKNTETLRAKLPVEYKRVAAKTPDLADAEFRFREWTQFTYKGDLRSGLVMRLWNNRVLILDGARGEPRLFNFDHVEGRPS